MPFILGKVFSPCAKTFISDRMLSFAPITSVPFINHYFKSNWNPVEIPYRKILQPVQVHQHRYFSINFNDSLYESATTNEATKFIIDLLIRAHDLSGFHWWGVLVATPLIFKIFYGIPCAIYQLKLIAKTELITSESKPLIINLKHEILIEGRQKKWTAQKMERNFKQETKKLMKKIMIDNNIHPFKIVILSLVQIPPLVLLTMSISKISNEVASGTLDYVSAALQFQVGGPFFCPDLSLPDPTFILPTTLLVFTLASFEINRVLKPQRGDLMTRIFKHIFRLFAGVFFFVALHMSSGLSLFWTSNAVFGLVQNLLLLSPRVRRFLRIPKTPSELEKPYSHLAQEGKNLANRLLRRK